MAKSHNLLIVASALCFLSLVGISRCHSDRFFVEGQVYCDTCRIEFVTRVSEFLEGARVRLECRNRTGGDIAYTREGVTDKNGRYSLPIDGDFEDDICEVTLVKSPREDCSELPIDPFARQAAKVSLTSNNGVVDPIRSANPLGFMISNPLPECHEVLKELALLDN
ncbi:hypothetical protein Nepgr_028963 [Nepenthes gracilis]|uniref:Uncharacterized protein n=1 Tax=Nepenthes gracilis TaxID=150966 RepID=A0AAD3Y4F0_NEPGR|nr:hypothetical protein Nepgr_028963 [Nepenthes gracilis]